MTAIVASELQWYYSTATGSAGNTTTGTAPTSLGKYISTTAWADGTTLFDDISGAENAAGTVDYRCVFIYNANTANALQNAVVFISSEVSGGATIALAADTTAASARGSSTAQALTGATETAPGSSITSLAYSSPTSAGTGISLGAIGVGQVKAVWVRRTATNSAALSNDGMTLAVSGDTGSL